MKKETKTAIKIIQNIVETAIKERENNHSTKKITKYILEYLIKNRNYIILTSMNHPKEVLFEVSRLTNAKSFLVRNLIYTLIEKAEKI